MPHPQSGQNLFAPRSTHEYHVQIFSKEHGDWLSSSIHIEPSDASETAAIVEKGFKGSKGARAPKVRVVKVAKHTVYSEPEEVQQKQSAADMAPADRRRLDKMLAAQVKGDNTPRTRQVAPKKVRVPKTVDLRNALDETPKKKGK
jgi:hypothetical protein